MLRSITRHWPLWLVATLAFPLGGIVGRSIGGEATTAISALIAGLAAGLVIGLGQALAIDWRRPSWRWIAGTGVASGVGLTVAVGLGLPPIATGLVTGALVGAAQAVALGADEPSKRRIGWVMTTVVAWSLGWTVTTAIGVDPTAGWAVFGSSGALTGQVVTLLGAIVLERGTRMAVAA
jgi:hypothetical protein